MLRKMKISSEIREAVVLIVRENISAIRNLVKSSKKAKKDFGRYLTGH